MQALIRTSVLALAALVLAAGSVDAQARSNGPGGGWGHSGGGQGGGWSHDGGWSHGGGWNHGGGWGRGGWNHRGRSWGGLGLGLGIGIGIGAGSYYYGAPYYEYGAPWYPGYVVTVPPPVYEVAPVPAEPLVKAPPDPVIYPRNGQSAAQTETDRQDCNRWATTQPGAMADASVFQRAALACMEGRGYTVR